LTPVFNGVGISAAARERAKREVRGRSLVYSLVHNTPYYTPSPLSRHSRPGTIATRVSLEALSPICHAVILRTLSTLSPHLPRPRPPAQALAKFQKARAPACQRRGAGRRRHWLSRRHGRESFSGRGPSGGGGCAEARDVEREVTHCLWRQVDLEAHRAHFRLHRPRHRALGLACVAWAARGRRGRWREADGACCREGSGCERVREACGAWWRVAACGVRVWGGGDGGGGGATLRAGPLCYLSAASPLPLLLPLRCL